MNFFDTPSGEESYAADFDALRAKVEAELERPCVLAITSSTVEDGRDFASRGLGSSLAATGFKTLLIEISLHDPATSRERGQTLEDSVSNLLPASGDSETLPILTLNGPLLQRTTSQRSIQATVDRLREHFDYIIVCAEFGPSSSFAASFIAVANAILATVRLRRRQLQIDLQLAAELERAGTRFFGVVTVDPELIDPVRSASKTPRPREERQRRLAKAEKDGLQQRARAATMVESALPIW